MKVKPAAGLLCSCGLGRGGRLQEDRGGRLQEGRGGRLQESRGGRLWEAGGTRGELTGVVQRPHRHSLVTFLKVLETEQPGFKSGRT